MIGTFSVIIVLGMIFGVCYTIYDIKKFNQQQQQRVDENKKTWEEFNRGLTARQRHYISTLNNTKPCNHTTNHMALEARIFALETKLEQLTSLTTDDGK